ncbi:lactonase drp35 [Fusarium mundagurra]|uniref:Lactonase drp35 n=1 Tax=Fusarium mundagurra TaxID=1567541 RepID=A0A8H5XUQ2_9HYPO|nr:lactonase drp35 [Fusarium mundagurra]
MNFYPAPPVIKAEIYLRIPDNKRCLGQESEWRGGFAGSFQHIFLEGPVVDSVGNLYIVDIPYGRILKIDGDKNVTVSCTWDGEPNGLVGTADGDLLVADYKQGILSFNPETGKIGPKLTRKNLERFKGPNDLIVDSKGNLYFTDQGQTGMTDPTGRVYRLSPDGRLDTLLDNGPSPNGLVLSRDERFLYVAMTRANQVWRLPLHTDGTTSKAGVFFQSFGNAGPDGLALDEEGNFSPNSVRSVFTGSFAVAFPNATQSLTRDEGYTISVSNLPKSTLRNLFRVQPDNTRTRSDDSLTPR